MDKRVYRTRRAIFDAYIDLSLTNRKFTIKDICENAGINKSTFYRNFKDLDDFRNDIIEKISDYIIENIKDFNLFFEDPKAFYLELLDVMESLSFCSNIKISKITESSVMLSNKINIIHEKNNKLYDKSKSIFLTGGIISFLKRNGDLTFKECVNDFRKNIDLITNYTIALMKC